MAVLMGVNLVCLMAVKKVAWWAGLKEVQTVVASAGELAWDKVAEMVDWIVRMMADWKGNWWIVWSFAEMAVQLEPLMV